ncbi:MAG: penicillin-binding protein 2 [Chloroflexi bacterium]|nr:penicillin-binding protein 2 [Chloroflexota bacterium]
MSGVVLGDPAPRGRLLPRFIVFSLIAVLVVGALGTRLFYLQVAQGGYYAALADDQRFVDVAVSSARGLMVDRAGRVLVTNVPTYVVKIRQADLPFSRREEVLQRLSTLLDIPVAEMNETLDRNPGSRFEYIRVASDIPVDVAHVLTEDHLSLPGVQVGVEPRREYPYGALVSHILGFTGAIDPDDFVRLEEKGYLQDDSLGKAGVEAVYETELRGTYGVEQVERDASGRRLRVVAKPQEELAGNTLELSIDVDLQKEAEKALRWGIELAGLKRGVFIVMNPQTGEVLAMVSLPNYDNNLFARGISGEDFDKLLKDPSRPLLNFAINEQYPPGSTYKLVTGTGGLADGKITTDSTLRTKGYLSIGRYRYYEWNRRGWGPLNIYDGFGHSSDTYFFQVAGRLGIDRLAYWAKQYGFGARTGIDLPGEARGIVPTNAWKQDVFGERIYPGETYQAGIGQGYDSATPLQVLNAYAALANGGKVFQPQVVRRILSADGTVVRDFEPKLIRQLDVDPEVLRTMRVAARRVVTIRHTYNLVDLPLVVAGKSGTAEFGNRDSKGRLPYHSWFAAFVPKDPRMQPGDPSGYRAVSGTDSELAVLAFAYDSRTKGNMATEIVKYFLQIHYKVKKDLRNFDLLKRANFYNSQGGN